MSKVYLSPDHSRWGQALEHLVGLSVNYNRDAPMPWRLKPPLQDGEPDYAARFRELESPVQEEIEQAILSLLERGDSGVISEAARIWVGIRVDVCIQFVSILSTRDGFLTCPCVPTSELVRWVLIDWWREHGAIYATSFDPERFP
jgi:hypothetical protein